MRTSPVAMTLNEPAGAASAEEDEEAVSGNGVGAGPDCGGLLHAAARTATPASAATRSFVISPPAVWCGHPPIRTNPTRAASQSTETSTTVDNTDQNIDTGQNRTTRRTEAKKYDKSARFMPRCNYGE